MEKINLLGYGHAYYLAEMLSHFDIIADNNSPDFKYYDVNLAIGLQSIPKNNRPENLAVFIMGSDYWNNKGKTIIPKEVKVILVPSKEIFEQGNLDISISLFWRMPVNEFLFNPDARDLFLRHFDSGRQRDTLLYAADMVDHCLESKIVPYIIANNKVKTITLIGGAWNNTTNASFYNVLTIPKVPYYIMPEMYLRHKEFRQWINHPGAGHPGIMCYEALRMGCKSFFNDKEVTEIPKSQLCESAIPKLIGLLEEYF